MGTHALGAVHLRSDRSGQIVKPGGNRAFGCLARTLLWEHACPVWTGTSYTVLYQARRGESMTGAPHFLLQWIVKMILKLIILRLKNYMKLKKKKKGKRSNPLQFTRREELSSSKCFQGCANLKIMRIKRCSAACSVTSICAKSENMLKSFFGKSYPRWDGDTREMTGNETMMMNDTQHRSQSVSGNIAFLTQRNVIFSSFFKKIQYFPQS